MGPANFLRKHPGAFERDAAASVTATAPAAAADRTKPARRSQRASSSQALRDFSVERRDFSDQRFHSGSGGI